MTGKGHGMQKITEAEAKAGLASVFCGRLERLIEQRREQFSRPELLREKIPLPKALKDTPGTKEAVFADNVVRWFSSPIWPPREMVEEPKPDEQPSRIWEQLNISRMFINMRPLPDSLEKHVLYKYRIGDVSYDEQGAGFFLTSGSHSWNVLECIQTAEKHKAAVSLAAATEVTACVELFVEPKLRTAVLSRPILAERWLWPDKHFVRKVTSPDGQEQHAAAAAMLLSLGIMYMPDKEKAPLYWPGEAAPLDAYEWLAKSLEKHALCPVEKIEQIIRSARSGFCQTVIIPCDGTDLCLSPPAIAALFLAERDVREGQTRERMHIDANEPHHKLVSGWRDVPKDIRKKHEFEKDEIGRVLLLPPNAAPIQLALELPGEPSLHECLVHALKAWRSGEGLRNWTALQRQFSTQGGRSGFVRWTLDEHMRAMGFSERTRNNPKVRERIASGVELLTQMELAIYSENGRERERRPLIMTGSKYEHLAGSQWRLDGMELQINQLLYAGVRSPNGQIGKNWIPVAAELAQVDDKKHPYAHALGLLIPIRQRLAMNNGLSHLTLSGQNIINLAGIKFSKRKPGESWGKLERDLDELVRVGVLGSWRWTSGPRTWTGMLCVNPAEWVLDAMVRGVQPNELPPGPQVCTGSELKAWRQARGLTQGETAKRLGVSLITVVRAEGAPEKTLSPRIQKAAKEAR